MPDLEGSCKGFSSVSCRAFGAHCIPGERAEFAPSGERGSLLHSLGLLGPFPAAPDHNPSTPWHPALGEKELLLGVRGGFLLPQSCHTAGAAAGLALGSVAKSPWALGVGLERAQMSRGQVSLPRSSLAGWWVWTPALPREAQALGRNQSLNPELGLRLSQWPDTLLAEGLLRARPWGRDQKTRSHF